MRAFKPFKAAVPAALLLALLLASQSVQADERSAQLAISQAAAKLDLVTKQGAAVTNHPSFMSAQKKMQAAELAYKDDDDQEAEWRAQEAGIYAEIALEASQLASLHASQRELENSVRILRSETKSY